jgi:hypothetical protein
LTFYNGWCKIYPTLEINKSKKSYMAKKNKKSIFAGNMAFHTPITLKRHSFTIELPKKVLEYIGADPNGKMFWYPTNGVLQLSGHGPKMVIPLMTIREDTFVPQPA